MSDILIKVFAVVGVVSSVILIMLIVAKVIEFVEKIKKDIVSLNGRITDDIAFRLRWLDEKVEVEPKVRAGIVTGLKEDLIGLKKLIDYNESRMDGIYGAVGKLANLNTNTNNRIDEMVAVDENLKPHALDCKNCQHNTVCKYAEIPVEEITKNQELPEIWAYDEDEGVICNMFKGV